MWNQNAALTSVSQDAVDAVFSPWFTFIHLPLHLFVVLLIVTYSPEFGPNNATDGAHCENKMVWKMKINTENIFSLCLWAKTGLSWWLNVYLTGRYSCRRYHLSVIYPWFPSWTFPGFLSCTPRFSCPAPGRRLALTMGGLNLFI